MPRLSRTARLLVALAALSFAGIALVYMFPPRDRAALSLLSDLCWIWASAYGAVCCFLAARRIEERDGRRAWLWIGAGCASFLAGQLVWTYHDVVLGAPPVYPSLADVGYLGVYACLLVGIATLLRAQPTRRADPELILDTVLVTFTAGALAYEFLLEPLIDPRASLIAVLTSIGWSIGGIAVLWMILIQMLRRTVFPLATAGLVLPGVVVVAAGNLAYAVVALRGTYQTGGLLDLTWDAGLLMLAAAAAVAPERGAIPGTALPGGAGLGPAARTVAILVGLLGMAALAIVAIMRPEPAPDVAVTIGIGMAIIATRVIYSLGVDRRYAQLLEEEVAHQTRSLMGALSAAASAEHSLRLLMESVPDAIVVLDREGHVLDCNAAGRAMLATRTFFEWLDPTVGPFVRENLLAAFDGELRRFEVPVRSAGGAEGVSAVLYAPVRERQRVTKVLGLVRDITEHRRTQAQLQQAEKLAAMGQLVSGVAHEINNPAAIISGFAQTLLLDELPPEHRETVQMIYDEATRIGRITSNLLAFARAGGKERSLLDLNEIVRRTFALRSYHLSTLNVTVTLELDGSDPRVWANGSELQQMLLNLLINAEQALTSVATRRTITVRTTAFEEHVRLQVADTGRDGDGPRVVDLLRHRPRSRWPHRGRIRDRPGRRLHRGTPPRSAHAAAPHATPVPGARAPAGAAGGLDRRRRGGSAPRGARVSPAARHPRGRCRGRRRRARRAAGAGVRCDRIGPADAGDERPRAARAAPPRAPRDGGPADLLHRRQLRGGHRRTAAGGRPPLSRETVRLREAGGPAPPGRDNR